MMLPNSTLASTASLAAQRIVALAPSLAELVEAAGAVDRLIAVSTLTDVPSAGRPLPIVAGPGWINIEAIVRLQPDTVLAWPSGNAMRAVARLRRAGIHIMTIESRTLADIPRAIRTIGAAAGTSAPSCTPSLA